MTLTICSQFLLCTLAMTLTICSQFLLCLTLLLFPAALEPPAAPLNSSSSSSSTTSFEAHRFSQMKMMRQSTMTSATMPTKGYRAAYLSFTRTIICVLATSFISLEASHWYIARSSYLASSILSTDSKGRDGEFKILKCGSMFACVSFFSNSRTGLRLVAFSGSSPTTSILYQAKETSPSLLEPSLILQNSLWSSPWKTTTDRSHLSSLKNFLTLNSDRSLPALQMYLSS